MSNYEEQGFDPTDEDDGTMPNNVASLAENVIGRRIVKAEKAEREVGTWLKVEQEVLVLTLDDGREVTLADDGDCCAYTELQGITEHLPSIDHVITGVRTTDGYTRWHIYADAGDVLELQVGWSCGNPFYYGYGFDIRVNEVSP